jgi:hypothetical protein
LPRGRLNYLARKRSAAVMTTTTTTTARSSKRPMVRLWLSSATRPAAFGALIAS